MKLSCSECNYSFSPRKEEIPTMCPYCSKEGTIHPAKDMQDLINDVSEEYGAR